MQENFDERIAPLAPPPVYPLCVGTNKPSPSNERDSAETPVASKVKAPNHRGFPLIATSKFDNSSQSKHRTYYAQREKDAEIPLDESHTEPRRSRVGRSEDNHSKNHGAKEYDKSVKHFLPPSARHKKPLCTPSPEQPSSAFKIR
ncbi:MULTISPECIES: hypothetical protein [unclassified Cohnella]|uniref:hypothetical protein n=1 Tax=unclassified Cohnella TaxID=2636738 RepID=UPI0013046947|nr:MULTISPECIES: hypothetical protein [unclassified Cohnella]